MDKKSLFYPSLSDILASFPHFYHHIARYALQKMRKIYSISQICAKQFLEVPYLEKIVSSRLQIINI